MPTAPGHTVIIGERAAANLAGASTSNGFFVGFTERGSVEAPIYVVSMTDAVEKTGERLTTEPLLYDSLDAFFRSGGSNAYIARVSPGAATASKTLADSESKKVRKVTAKSPGSWGNNIKVSVTLSEEEVVYVVKYNGTTVEQSPSLASLAEEEAWAKEESAYIEISEETEGEGPLPKTQEVTLSGGTYSTSSATTEQIETAIGLFGEDLGPGQIAMPGNSSEAVAEALQDHAAENNRRAILDLDQEATAAEVVSGAVARRNTNGKFSAVMANWAVIPGLSLGTTRKIPLSGLFMGLIANVEAQGYTPNVAAAAKRGRSEYAIDLVTSFTDTQRGEIDEAGAIPARLKRGVVEIYGDVTPTNPLTEKNWRSFAGSRLAMGVAAKADEVLDDYDFEQIDGPGLIFGKLKGDLTNVVCMPYYKANSFYGTTPEEAFLVNTGPDVNTPASIAANELKAQIAFKVSPHADYLTVEIVKVSITDNI